MNRDSSVPPSSNDDALPLALRPKSMAPRPGPVPKHLADATRPRGTVREAVTILRRGRLSMAGAIVVASLTLVAIFADVLASDLPLVGSVGGSTYVLPNVTHPPALAKQGLRPFDWAIFPLVRFGPETVQVPLQVLSAPTLVKGHPLGTDALGRDVFARIVHGTRTSLGVGVLAVVAFVSLGGLLGALAGFFGGVFDAFVARLIETLTAFPTLILVLVVQALVPRPTMITLLAAIALTRWTEVARLVRAEVMLVGSQDYVLAARALGASPLRVLWRHIAPNARAPALVSATFGVASVVLIEAALDFLHVGDTGHLATWGETIGEAREHMGAWWLLVFPGLSIFACVVSLNLVGEALRDALDPRLRATAFGRSPGPTEAQPRAESPPLRDSKPPSSVAFDDTPHA